MKLLVFAASHRPESHNRKLAKLAAAHAVLHGMAVDFAEYSEFDMPVYNDTQAHQGIPEQCRIFGERAAKAHGIILSTPEYNWSYPGSLKNIIDWTSRMHPMPLAGKTALLLSATTGARGGIMSLNHLKTPLEALQMYVFPRAFPLSHSETAFAGDALADERKNRQITSMIEEYVTFMRKLANP